MTKRKSTPKKRTRSRTAKPASNPLIELEQCSLVLDDHLLLDDVSFELRPGERWALVGANGSGKTMLLKMLRGDMWPTPTGRERRVYRFDGEVSTIMEAKPRIAYVGAERQDKYVRYDWDLTVTQVVTTGLFDEDIPLTKPTAAQRAKVERMLKRFGLWSLRARKFLLLSYGQRRRALVARAFVSDADVLLLDEVFNGLDARAKHQLRQALETPRERHAWIITSHRPEELPANVTHIAYLQKGRMVARGPVGSEQVSQVAGLREKRAAQRSSKHGKQARVVSSAHVSVPVGSKARRPKQGWLVRISNADIYRDYRPVIRNLDWTIHRGEHWAVLGANGSGKSTLLKMIYGDLHPALGGRIERRGAPPGSHIATWKRRVGWVSPELQADHYLAESIEEIVISGRYSSTGLNEAPTATDRRVATRWLRFFEIEHLRDRGPRQVSYGQMRLAFLARAMVNDPEMLLLDEPCTGLDGDVRANVLAMLQRIAERGTQLVMALHDPGDMVPAVMKVLAIRRGGTVVMGTR